MTTSPLISVYVDAMVDKDKIGVDLGKKQLRVVVKARAVRRDIHYSSRRC